MIASGKDPPDRVWPLRSGQSRAAWAWKTGDLQFSWLYLHLRKIAQGQIPRHEADPARPHVGEARGNQGGTATANAPAHPRTRTMAKAGCHRLFQLPRRADKQRGVGRLPPLRHRPLAALATAAQPEGPDDMGADEEVGRRLASKTPHPSSLAERSLRRQAPEVRAGCPNGARPDLCGGTPAMVFPTAIGLM